ncbi:MAG TPA: glycosyltransferase [Chitinophagaceae bacterium]|nr:glycosyltransferase [Chitinophagales bacterium]HNE93484.1 glycosyltransferase [Chitinophagaceae bacterium]HNL82173.1 glycosyltransferase [Chitinophagaceae bacterium]
MKYSIVVPVFNSANSIENLLRQLCLILEQYSFEIIFVDDGSCDESWKILVSLKKIYSEQNIKLVKLTSNFGQQNATICGLTFADGDFIITIDDDLQIQPKEIHKLIHKQEHLNVDVVYGIYKPQHSFIKSIFRIIGFSIFSIINPSIVNTSSFRLIRKNIVNKIASHHDCFINIDEITRHYTNSISTQEVEHHKRVSGKSGYTLPSLLRLAFCNILNYYPLIFRIIIFLFYFLILVCIGFFLNHNYQIFHYFKYKSYYLLLPSIFILLALMGTFFSTFFLYRITPKQNTQSYVIDIVIE